MSVFLKVRCDAAAGPLRLQVDADFTAPWTVLFGPSGSGKTSLLRLLAGLWMPSLCSVKLRGEELAAVAAHRRRVVLVAQQPAVFPHKSVRDNVAFGVRQAEGSQVLVDTILDQFRLGGLASQSVNVLSGGEAQRVCLARALATKPRLLLLDESFSGLHRGLRDELVQVLRDVQSNPGGMPIVSVTHDVGEAFLCADEVVRMEAGQVVARGTAADVLAPERAALLRQMSASYINRR